MGGYEGRSKDSKPDLERSAIAEYVCCAKTLPLRIKLEKLIQISFLISVQVKPIKIFWTVLICMYVCIYVCMYV